MNILDCWEKISIHDRKYILLLEYQSIYHDEMEAICFKMNYWLGDQKYSLMISHPCCARVYILWRVTTKSISFGHLHELDLWYNVCTNENLLSTAHMMLLNQIKEVNHSPD